MSPAPSVCSDDVHWVRVSVCLALPAWHGSLLISAARCFGAQYGQGRGGGGTQESAPRVHLTPLPSEVEDFPSGCACVVTVDAFPVFCL